MGSVAGRLLLDFIRRGGSRLIAVDLCSPKDAQGPGVCRCFEVMGAALSVGWSKRCYSTVV